MSLLGHLTARERHCETHSFQETVSYQCIQEWHNEVTDFTTFRKLHFSFNHHSFQFSAAIVRRLSSFTTLTHPFRGVVMVELGLDSKKYKILPGKEGKDS